MNITCFKVGVGARAGAEYCPEPDSSKMGGSGNPAWDAPDFRLAGYPGLLFAVSVFQSSRIYRDLKSECDTFEN